jgi:hypothetical protein
LYQLIVQVAHPALRLRSDARHPRAESGKRVVHRAQGAEKLYHLKRADRIHQRGLGSHRVHFVAQALKVAF